MPDGAGRQPAGLALPRIGMDPPAWWYELHPDDRDGLGRRTARRTPTRSWPRPHTAAMPPSGWPRWSPTWKQSSATTSPAIIPVGQNTGEWFYQDTWRRRLTATPRAICWHGGPGSRRATTTMRRCGPRGTIPQATLDTAAVPSLAARRAAPAGVLRDPAAERSLIDFALFQQEAMADCVCQLAHAVRQASHGRKLVVFFYGYVFEFGPVAGGPAISGHYALAPRAELPRHRRALLADLLFRPRAGPECPGDDGRRERRPGRQDVALRRRHADLPGQRLPASQSRRHARENEPRTAAQHGPVRAAQLRHLVDGPGRHRLVQRPADVGGDDAAQGPRRAALEDAAPVPAGGGRRDRPAEHDPRGRRRARGNHAGRLRSAPPPGPHGRALRPVFAGRRGCRSSPGQDVRLSDRLVSLAGRAAATLARHPRRACASGAMPRDSRKKTGLRSTPCAS